MWYEWNHVYRGADREPRRVCISVSDILHHDRATPHYPLRNDAPSNLHFTVEYMQAFADLKCAGTVYEGISFEGDRPQLCIQLPDGGRDIQDHAVHWTLPCGRTECWSLREFADAQPDQLAGHDCEEAYKSIGSAMEWDVLGTGDEGVIAALRDDPGMLAEKRWLSVAWQMPPKETSTCW